LDPKFFEKNIPEAFRVRVEMQAERENKRVEVLGKFFDLITNSNMIGKGKHFHHLITMCCVRQQERSSLLRLLVSL